MSTIIAFKQSDKADNDAAKRKNEYGSEAVETAKRQIGARIEALKATEKIQPGHAHPRTEQTTAPAQDLVEKFIHWLKDERKTLETLKMMVTSPSGNKTHPAIRIWNKLELLRGHDFKLDFSKKLRPHDKSEDHCSLIWLQFSRISPYETQGDCVNS